MKSKFYFMAMGLVLVLCAYSSAQVPQTINYQGKLTNASGAPITDTLQIVFTIYADEAGTTPLWTETQSAVEILKGVFNVLLGSVNPISFSVFDGTTRYLGVQVGGDPEITPRKAMVSVAYAMRAGTGGGGSDNDWTYRITDTADTTLVTGGAWGIARYGSTLYGNADSTHVNLGVASTTGTNGQNYKYCTVGGGRNNSASGSGNTIGGGVNNTASGPWYATIGGGQSNTASNGWATIGGGISNIVDAYYGTVGGGMDNTAGYSATVGGGVSNTAEDGGTIGGGESNKVTSGGATIPGGVQDTVAGYCSFATGKLVRVTSSAEYTFAFGYDFTTSASHAVIFHDASTPIKVGIGTTNPDAM